MTTATAPAPVLVTGFEPFGRTPVNPAERVARALDGRTIAGRPVVGRVIENTFDRCVEQVAGLVGEHRPELVLMLGEYGGRALIAAERVAINLDDSARYGLADNAGVVRSGRPSVPDGPPAYFASAPLRRMVAAMRTAGVPADISDTAGTNVCNHLLYGVLHHVARHALAVRVGWLHLPALPEVAALEHNLGMPSMAAETALAGVSAAIEAAAGAARDAEAVVVSRWQI